MIKRLFAEMLNDALPAKTKRQMFLVSFVALLKDVTSFDQETFQKLNRVLSLSESTDKALAVPVILSKVIWSGKSPSEICQHDFSTESSYSAEGITDIVGNLLKNIPTWLLYGKTEEIEKDIAVILNNRVNLGM
jgi:hypothetical protein